MTEPSGYRPGGDCSCCGNCGIFCIDKDVPCLSVAFGTSTRIDSVPSAPCLDGVGWDCDGHAAEGETPDTRACLPDGATIEMTGEQGSVVERLPDWAVSEDYTPLAGSYFCRWGTTIELREPFCICPNNDGTCSESWLCESCDCYWTDPGCPPGTNCQEDAQCWCYGYITSCDTGCHEVSCYAGAFDCTLGTCCNVLDPNYCFFYPGNTCQGNDAFLIGTYGCDWACDPYNYGNLCSTPWIPFRAEIRVIVYRTDDNHVIMAVWLGWGTCAYSAIEDLGEGPIDCCDIAVVPSFTHIPVLSPNYPTCCCSLPSVSIVDCCGGI